MDDTSQLHPPISTENRSNEERIPAGSRRRRQLLRDDDNQNDIPRVRSKTVEVSTSEIPSQVSGPKMRINATEQGNDGVGANALDQNQNTVLPPALETNHLKRLRVSMNEFRAKYPTDQLNAWQFATSSAIGKFKGCFFYLSDDEEARGMAFRAAYDAVPDIKNSHELCTYVGSMLCDVFPGFRSSVEAALNGIGVKPLFVRLPSVACDHNLKRVSFPKMDCPTILVNFGCCVLVVLMKMERRTNYETVMRNCIGELQGRAGCVPYASNLNLPFEFYMADEIRTMLGASSNLRANIVKFLISNIDQGDTGLGGVCRYLCDVLSWSGMHEFTLLNELLVRPRSPVLLDPRVSREVDNLTEACEAIASCPYPQFFMHLANNLELIKVEPLRFPTLIAVARELEWGHNGCSTVADSEATLAPNPTTVLALVELHRITTVADLRCKMKNNNVPPSSESKLNRLSVIKMKEIRAEYATAHVSSNTPSAIGKLTDFKLYISDDENTRLKGMTFRTAYYMAASPYYAGNKELCASVGSMMCEVYPGFQSSVEAALRRIGIRPLLVRLPSEARDRERNIEMSDEVPWIDWPNILVIFGYCILLILKKMTITFMRKCVGELKERAGCDPDAYVENPFDCEKANAISTMLGASSILCAEAVRFLVSNIDRGDTGIRSVCQYLCNVLSWSGMGEFTLMNDMLVRPQSPVLLDHRVSREVDNLTEACETVASCPHPQFFMHLASNSELLKLESSRFPTLIAVAEFLKKGGLWSPLTIPLHMPASAAGADPTTIYELLELHQTALG